MPEKILNMRSERQMYDLILGFAKTDASAGYTQRLAGQSQCSRINIRIMI